MDSLSQKHTLNKNVPSTHLIEQFLKIHRTQNQKIFLTERGAMKINEIRWIRRNVIKQKQINQSSN